MYPVWSVDDINADTFTLSLSDGTHEGADLSGYTPLAADHFAHIRLIDAQFVDSFRIRFAFRDRYGVRVVDKVLCDIY